VKDGERVCQNLNLMLGLTRKLAMGVSSKAGWGCFMMEDLRKGDFIVCSAAVFRSDGCWLQQCCALVAFQRTKCEHVGRIENRFGKRSIPGSLRAAFFQTWQLSSGLYIANLEYRDSRLICKIRRAKPATFAISLGRAQKK
jgi:hypothetical protein